MSDSLTTTAARRSERRQRTELVALRLLPEERALLADVAKERGISLSELIRTSAIEHATAGQPTYA